MYGNTGGQTPMISGFGSATPVYGLGGQTPAYVGPSGGRTPLVPIGGRTPLYAGNTTTTTTTATPSALSSSDAMNQVANKFNLQCDIPWGVSGVKVEIVGGNYRGKLGTIKRISETTPTASITIEGTHTVTNISILDLLPMIPIADSYVRVLSGSYAGKKLKVVSVTDELNETGQYDALATDPDHPEITEFFPFNVLVRMD